MAFKNKEELYKYQIFRWRKIKEKAIEYKGGCCTECGYKKHPAALQFHHLRDKKDSWGQLRKKSWDKIIEELDKCVLMCANCHSIEHSKSKYEGQG